MKADPMTELQHEYRDLFQSRVGYGTGIKGNTPCEKLRYSSLKSKMLRAQFVYVLKIATALELGVRFSSLCCYVKMSLLLSSPKQILHNIIAICCLVWRAAVCILRVFVWSV